MTTTDSHHASATRSPRRAEYLAHAQASPTAVAARDKKTWLGLFADRGAVLDPVGTPACAKGAHTLGRSSGQDDLGRFYDCFIASNTIRFDVARDLVAGRHVVRDVTIFTTGPSGITTPVPAHLIYTMADGPGPIAIERMEAFWQPADVMRTVRRAGVRGAGATLVNVWQLVRFFGFAGTRAYLRGIEDRPRSSAARKGVRDWVAAVGAATADSACDVELPGGERVSMERALATELHGWALEAEKILVCGWSASCSLRMRRGDRERHAVAVFELAPPAARICRVRLYWEVE